MDMSALYTVRYMGGAAVLIIGKGTILGIDVGEIRYRGGYTKKDAQLIAKVTMTAPKNGSMLVTGALLPGGQN